MVSEVAVLGDPGIYIDPVGRGYTDEQEKEYGIVFNFTQQQQDEAVEKAASILSHYQKEKWRAIGGRIIEEKIDVTDMIHKVATTRGD
jgi:predicted glycosyltransferase